MEVVGTLSRLCLTAAVGGRGPLVLGADHVGGFRGATRAVKRSRLVGAEGSHRPGGGQARLQARRANRSTSEQDRRT